MTAKDRGGKTYGGRETATNRVKDRGAAARRLQKLPTLHDTQSVTVRPYSGPKSWTWELDRIEPEVGPEQSKFADVMGVVARLQQQYDLDLSPPPPA